MDPTRPTADTCKKIIKHKQNKKIWKTKKINQKKEKTFRLIPLSLPSLNCKAYYLSRLKKRSQKLVQKSQKKKNLTFSGREPCVVLCGIIIKNKQTNCKLNKKMEKSLFKKHSGLFLDYCGRKPVKIAVSPNSKN